jgi:6-phosphogluconolactonase (cycloisomerase 2 family)
VQSFPLDEDGDVALEPRGSGDGEFQSDYSSLALNGQFLYAGARDSQIIDTFILRSDGHVPLLAEPQDPYDRIALPDDIVIRDGTLYVTSASDKSIRAYTLNASGFPGDEETSRTKGQDYYADILLDGDLMYTAGYTNGRVDLYNINPDGSLDEEEPFFNTIEDPSSYPSHLIKHEGILYVAQAGWNRIDAYALDARGVPSPYPISSTTPAPDITSYPLSMALFEID